jgi:uncharacterized protein (DUF885 family)
MTALGLALGLALLGLAACGAPPPPAPAPAANVGVPADRLNRLAERYWDELAAPGVPISPQFMADSLGLERRLLAEVLAIPRAALDGESRLTYDILVRRLELDIEGLTYPAELLPVNPFEGPPQDLVSLAAGTAEHPLKSAKDYEHWLLRIDNYALWSRQAIANMREGMRRGYTLPRSVVERMLPLLQRFGEDTDASVFYWPLRNPPQNLAAPERSQLAQRLTGAVKDKLLPAFREMHDFMQRDYLPRARQSVALSALPLGPSWYAFRVKRATGNELTPAEIHVIGLAEVERIRTRLAALAPPAVAPAPTPAAGARVGAAALRSSYAALQEQTLAALPLLFTAAPPADVEIRESTLLGDGGRPLVYQPAAPDAAAAVLYVNAAPNEARPPGVTLAGFLAAAIPGRHYQSAIQQARVDLPKFRRYGAEPGFVDGWALYAASLGEELGLVHDEDGKRDALMAQLNCAAALVVDTGLHAKGWTREQAADYLRAQLGADAAETNAMIDRFAALPGDALACKMGELKIQALRHRAQTALAARFDIHEFHSRILNDGAMPLDILEAKMRLSMEARP